MNAVVIERIFYPDKPEERNVLTGFMPDIILLNSIALAARIPRAYCWISESAVKDNHLSFGAKSGEQAYRELLNAAKEI